MLPEFTRIAVLNALRETLIVCHLDTLCRREPDGIAALLLLILGRAAGAGAGVGTTAGADVLGQGCASVQEQEQGECLERVFTIMHGTPQRGINTLDSAVETLAEVFQQAVETTGAGMTRVYAECVATARDAKSGGTAKPATVVVSPAAAAATYVQQLVALHIVGKDLLSNAFRNHLRIGRGFAVRALSCCCASLRCCCWWWCGVVTHRIALCLLGRRATAGHGAGAERAKGFPGTAGDVS